MFWLQWQFEPKIKFFVRTRKADFLYPLLNFQVMMRTKQKYRLILFFFCINMMSVKAAFSPKNLCIGKNIKWKRYWLRNWQNLSISNPQSNLNHCARIVLESVQDGPFGWRLSWPCRFLQTNWWRSWTWMKTIFGFMIIIFLFCLPSCARNSIQWDVDFFCILPSHLQKCSGLSQKETNSFVPCWMQILLVSLEILIKSSSLLITSLIPFPPCTKLPQTLNLSLSS